MRHVKCEQKPKENKGMNVNLCEYAGFLHIQGHMHSSPSSAERLNPKQINIYID